jgi:hypothetical protein
MKSGPFGEFVPPSPASKSSTPAMPCRFMASRSAVMPWREAALSSHHQYVHGLAESGGRWKARSSGELLAPARCGCPGPMARTHRQAAAKANRANRNDERPWPVFMLPSWTKEHPGQDAPAAMPSARATRSGTRPAFARGSVRFLGVLATRFFLSHTGAGMAGSTRRFRI